MDMTVGLSTRDLVLAELDRVTLVVWRGRTTVAGLQCTERFIHEHVERSKNFALVLTLVEAAAPLPPLESRREIAETLARGNGRIERSALVFEGDWMRAASVRAVVAGATLFAAPNYPHRVFSALAPALRFLCAEEEGAAWVERISELVCLARSAPPTADLREFSSLERRHRCGWSV